MTLHVFNPEHDMALAANLANFTAPHAGRQLRCDLGFLPVLWAREGDLVLVDDVVQAERGLKRLVPLLSKMPTSRLPWADVSLACGKRLVCPELVTRVEPWGWDAALRSRLLRLGVAEGLLPTTEGLATIRRLSHRRLAAGLLRGLREGLSADGARLVGEAYECENADVAARYVSRWPRTVLKAPWSSSGRGLRFVSDVSACRGWLGNLLQRQGCVMAEPYYNKVKDFGMEFVSDGHGRVAYLGLSLFHTRNGAYTGNVLATEARKREAIGRYVPTGLLDRVQEAVCLLAGEALSDGYEGPFGVDMMVVAQDDARGFALHPCVEVNLRRTMGHVALALTRLLNPTDDDDVVSVMRVVLEENSYKLKIQRL